MRCFLLLPLLLICILIQAQIPDNINILINDTVHDISDCVVTIKLSKKNNGFFQFPSKYMITDEIFLGSDLVVRIEKKVGDKYVNYECDWATVHHDNFIGDSIKYKYYKRLKIIDSLTCLSCLTRGLFRIKVLYNKRDTDGTIDFQKFVSSSNWSYFYVDSTEIILNRFYYEESKQKVKHN